MQNAWRSTLKYTRLLQLLLFILMRLRGLGRHVWGEISSSSWGKETLIHRLSDEKPAPHLCSETINIFTRGTAHFIFVPTHSRVERRHPLSLDQSAVFSTNCRILRKLARCRRVDSSLSAFASIALWGLGKGRFYGKKLLLLIKTDEI